MKGKEEASENVNWKTGNSTIRHWVQSNGYQEAHWAHRELPETTGKLQWLTENYINMKKEIETINKGQEEMKNTTSDLKNTVEGIKSRLDEAEDRISQLEDKVEKKHPEWARKRKEAQKELRGIKGNAGQHEK